jgi:hypothetical protein
MLALRERVVVTRAKQAEQEVRWVTEMAKAAALDLACPPTHREAPDVLVTLRDGSEIGVEVVTAMDRDIRSGYSGQCATIAKDVKQAMIDRRLSATIGLVIPRAFLADLRRHKRDGVAARRDAVVGAIRDAFATPLPRDMTGWVYEDLSDGRLPSVGFHNVGGTTDRGLDFVRSLSISPAYEPNVYTAILGDVQGTELVQAAIDDKADLHAKYSAVGLSDLWLLVVGPLSSGTTFGATRIKDGMFTSPYARTYFLDGWEGTCVLLNTQP